MKSCPLYLHLGLMNITRNIIIVLVSISYLLPSTGFYYVKHHCEHSGISKIVWQDEYSCHDNAQQHSCCGSDHKTGKQKSSCLVDEPHTNCCENEIHYIKDSSVYDQPSGKTKSIKKIQITHNIAAWQDHSDYHPAINRNIQHSPPDNKSSGSLYITYQSMIL